MMAAPDRISRLDAALAELELLEVSEVVLTALKEEIFQLKNSAGVESAASTRPESFGSDSARVVAEIRQAKEEVKRSVAFSDAKRTAILRALQLKWHPDKQYGDEATKEMAGELMATVNEAMRVAKINIKARQERDAFLTRAYRGAPGVTDNPDSYQRKNTGPCGF